MKYQSLHWHSTSFLAVMRIPVFFVDQLKGIDPDLEPSQLVRANTLRSSLWAFLFALFDFCFRIVLDQNFATCSLIHMLSGLFRAKKRIIRYYDSFLVYCHADQFLELVDSSLVSPLATGLPARNNHIDGHRCDDVRWEDLIRLLVEDIFVHDKPRQTMLYYPVSGISTEDLLLHISMTIDHVTCAVSYLLLA